MEPTTLEKAAQESTYDETVFPLFTTYHHIPVLLGVYIAVIKYYGPKFMKDRKAFDMNGIVKAYNLFQIGFNSYLIYLCWSLLGFKLLDLYGNPCNPVTSVNNMPYVKEQIFFTTYYYYLNKILDCVETLFFILRKKESQVTHLHVYHHLIMIASSWYSSFFLREEILVQFIFLNTLVHVLMYMYYFCASLGPKVQKYLWWKKYLTRIQIVQFLLVIGVLTKMNYVCDKCQPGFILMWNSIIITVLILFLNFYVQTYIFKKKVR